MNYLTGGIIVKRALSIVLLFILGASLIPFSYTSANKPFTAVNYSVTKVSPEPKETENTPISPIDKIEPKLLEILKNKKETTQNNLGILLIHIISRDDITNKLKGIKIHGKARLLDNYVYLAEIPLKRESIKNLLKVASIPSVEAITRTNPVEPIDIYKNEESPSNWIKLPKSKFAERARKIKPRESLDGKRVLSFKEALSGKLRALRENSPAIQGEAKLATQNIKIETPPQPSDYFAIYHHGAWSTWLDLGVTGKGINVAVIDSGVDFGNPDLQDAYAIETNPDSPYYGWPIAFDGNSMLYYLIFGATFADFATFSGYLSSWYANTSYPIEPYPVYGYFGIGYKGNYTTVFTSMSLANIPDDNERAQLINNTLGWIGNVSNVLLVDDDGGDILELFYMNALDSLGVSYTYYEVPNETSNGPNATTLSNYSLVIWFTGATYNNTLTNADIGNLTQYLENGGKLWLISSDYLYDGGLDNTTVKYNFTINYLHVSGAIEDYPVPTVIYDYAGNAYYGGEIYQGLWESPTDLNADYLIPDENATILLIGYTVYAWDPQLGGYYYDIKLPLDKKPHHSNNKWNYETWPSSRLSSLVRLVWWICISNRSKHKPNLRYSLC